LTFEIRTNGEAVSTGATGDQVDDTCTEGGDAVDQNDNGSTDGNCITFGGFDWPTDNMDDFTLVCPDPIGPIEGCTTDDINEGNADFAYSTAEVDITGMMNNLVITGCVPDSIFYIDSEPVIGACPYNFTVTRTYRVVDPCGEELTCTQDITVEDTTPPTIVCADNVTGLDCNTTALPDVPPPTVMDNCSPPDAITIEMSDDMTIDQIDPCVGGVITRTYTPTDECGNVGTPCTVTFTFIADETPPIIVCPEPANTNLLCGEVPDPGMATATDNCTMFEAPIAGVPDLTPDQIDPCVGGVITYTFTAVDDCGLEASCTQTFTYGVDTDPPVFNEDEPMLKQLHVPGQLRTIVVMKQFSTR